MLTYEKLEAGIFHVKSNSLFGATCNGILIKTRDNSGNILIDCNFHETELKELQESLKHEITAYFASHTHLDHVSNIHFYEDAGVNIYCPIPEDRYLKDMNIFIRENGMVDFAVGKIFRRVVYEELNFKDLTSVNPVEPGSKFNYGNITMETIPIPGHSPGQTAYFIRSKNSKRKKVLFVSDIGIEKSGPWYGMKHCSLKDYRDSLKKIEDLYLKDDKDDTILTSSHGKPYYTKQPDIFKNALRKININEEKVLSLFSKNDPKSLNDVTLKGLYYPKKFIANLDMDMRRIHECWEGYIILHHINELINMDKLLVDDMQQKTFILK